MTVLLLWSGFGGLNLRGTVITPNEQASSEDQVVASSSQEVVNDGSCTTHEDCASGLVCKQGECVQAETAYCSQPFMLAEAVEGRFIRYTQCSVRCVANGDTAHCE